MTWTKNASIIGTSTCTQFQNTAQNELNPQTAYQTTPFITSNTTTAQTITFASFDSLTKTSSVDTKTLTATASSGLTVTLTSLDTTIATITGGNTLNALSAGTVYIQATQAGNGTYDPATPIICVFTITLELTQAGPSGNLSIPMSITASTLKNNVKTITVSIDNIRYTQYTGISYGYATGFRGSAMVGSINSTDTSDNPVTDFSSNSLNLTVSMAHANTGHIYKLYKRNGTSLVDPQPTGYPVTLTYVSGYNWTGSMTALSDVVILDETPPSGNAGGDPYIISVKNVKTLLPNDWAIVKLLETDTVKVVANCDFLSKCMMSDLHFINKNKQECSLIDPNIHKWVRDLTYIVTLEVMEKNSDKKLVINTISGEIIYDNSPIIYETIKDSKFGLFSITHGGYYPQVEFKQHILHFNEGYITISVDNFWDDINYIQLFLHHNNYDKYTGELIEHNISNAIQINKSDE